MKRRTFLSGSGAALGLGGLGWIGCGAGTGADRARALGRPGAPARVPVVDLHCHNFNGEDISLAAFLSGKFHEVQPWMMAPASAIAAKLGHIAAPSARCERELLAGEGGGPVQEVAHYPLEIARWLMGVSVASLLARVGLGPSRLSELGLDRRFLADVQEDAIARVDPEVERARALHAARGHRFSRADRLAQLLGLVALGLVNEGRDAVLTLGGLVLHGAKVLGADERRRLERSAQERYVQEFERLHGAELDRQIARDAPLLGGGKLTQVIGEIARRGEEALGAAGLARLAESGRRLLALFWSPVRGYGTFATNFFRYRHDLSRDIATTYAKVDLFVPSLVDFAYWTGTAEQPRSRLADQIAVQRQLALTAFDSVESGRRGGDGGRFPLRAAFLPFIPFNPLREVLSPSTAGYEPRPLDALEGALDLVRAAVLEHGFIGVKMYPPVGFAPIGNDRHRRWEDGRLGKLDDSLPPRQLREWRSKKGELGRHLDEALRALYRFCQEREVPILAHSNDSNDFEDGYGWCGGPNYWRSVLDEFGRLRICLGHFGHFTGVDDKGDPAAPHPVGGCFGQAPSFAWSYQAADLFARGQVYVDLSNSEAGTDEAARERLTELIRKLDSHSRGLLRERLMYGSDWFMNVLNGPYERFFDSLESAFSGAWDDDRVVADVMGGNALRFLGLVPGPDGAIPANLERVRRHYGAHLPAWLR